MTDLLSVDLKTKLQEIKVLKPNSKDGQNIMAPFLEIFQCFLGSLEDKFESFKREMIEMNRAKDKQIDMLQTDLHLQKKENAKLQNKLDDLAQYSRRESLVVSGDSVPLFGQQEDCIQIVCTIISGKLGNGTKITPADVSIAHRLGPKPSSGVDRRSIIVRFIQRKLSYDILNAARKKKVPQLYVSESLTPNRQAISRALRKAKRDFPNKISGFTTIDGSIFVWVKPPRPDAEGARNSRVNINTLDKLEEFCQKNFGQPASNFLPEREVRQNV